MDLWRLTWANRQSKVLIYSRHRLDTYINSAICLCWFVSVAKLHVSSKVSHQRSTPWIYIKSKLNWIDFWLNSPMHGLNEKRAGSSQYKNRHRREGGKSISSWVMMVMQALWVWGRWAGFGVSESHIGQLWTGLAWFSPAPLPAINIQLCGAFARPETQHDDVAPQRQSILHELV